MGGKAPKITPAQRELEQLQIRTLREQEREKNYESARIAATQRRLLLGEMGYSQLLYGQPDPNLPTAQAAGTTMAPDLVDPATAAMQKRERLLAQATGFGANFAAATVALRRNQRI
jgi:hypothetical protein